MLRYLLIAEDHPICFEALKAATQSRDSAIFVESAESLSETINRLSERDYSALLLDLGLKDSAGVVNLKVIRDRYPELPILIISATDDLAVKCRTQALGAQGFLSKKAGIEDMAEAIITVMDGGSHFDFSPEEAVGDVHLLGRLSPAQIRILQELLKGHSNKIIAHHLDISESTVKSHLNAIFRTLGVVNRSQAIMKFSELSE